MPLRKSKDEVARRKAEHELTETTLGMLSGNDAPGSPTHSHNGSVTLPSRWQTDSEQSKRIYGRRGTSSRTPPTIGFINGTIHSNPRSYNSLSSHDSGSTPVSQRSGFSWAPSSPRSPGPPGSPQSLNMQPKRFGTWEPSSPMSTQQAPTPLPATLRLAPAPLTHTYAPTTNLPPDPLPEMSEPNTQMEPAVEKKLHRTRQTPVAGYKRMKKDSLKQDTFVSKHKHLVLCLGILFMWIFLIAITVAALTASGVLDQYFKKKGITIPYTGNNCTNICGNNKTYLRSPLVVIALDGFRYSYLESYAEKLPHLQRISDCGVKAELVASFPASTAPNLWTIVSGYYPQYHGVVSDWIRNHKTGEVFDPRINPNGKSTKDASWFKDPSIWEIAKLQGKITASQQWVGDMMGNVEHAGETVDRSPTYVDTFDRSRNYTLRMMKIVEWLRLPIDKRPDLITVYFEDPGTTAREHGTESIEVIAVLKEIDGAIGHLRKELMKDDALGCVNIVIVSTSGMVNVDCDRVYYLSDNLNTDFLNNTNDFTVSPDYLGSMAMVTPKKQAPDDLNTPAKIVDHLKCNIQHGEAYLTDFLPYRLHAANGHHLEEVVVLMNEGWTFAKQRAGYTQSNCKGANDGYDPFTSNMKGIFLGSGNDFKMGESIDSFQNIELFNLMTDLIGVTPLPHAPSSDGTKGLLNDALEKPKSLPTEKWDLIVPDNQQCEFPQERRSGNVECACTPFDLNIYAETQGMTFEEIDENLKRNHDATYNAPFGIPGVRNDINPTGEFVCILYQESYITSFDRFLKIPTFVSFTLSRNSPNQGVDVAGICIRYDQRLDPNNTPKCSDYTFDLDKYHDIELNVLYQPSLADGIDAVFDSQITSNIVPQYRTFKKDIWGRVYNLILNWAKNSDHVNIVVGPAYDIDGDSVKDSYYKLTESIVWVGSTPLPTHYFVVATRCHRNVTAVSLRGCAPEDIQFISYIFAHVKEIPPCFNFNNYLRNNLATLHDVETLTGLVFFPEMSRNKETRLKMMRLKARYPYNSAWTGL